MGDTARGMPGAFGEPPRELYPPLPYADGGPVFAGLFVFALGLPLGNPAPYGFGEAAR